jgi:hypothetical protein
VARTLSTLAAVILAVLTLGVSPAASDTRAMGGSPDPGAALTRLIGAVGGRGAALSPQRYAYLEKLDSHLQDVAASRLGAGSPESARAAAHRQSVTISPQGEVSVDVYVNGSVARAADRLRALGMRVIAVSDRAPQRMVEGFLPAGALASAAALAEVHAILSTFAISRTGSVLSEGDAAINGPQARLLGSTGAGVLVGIISTSINHVGMGIAGSQATNDLPANVQNLRDQPGTGGSDEGRAMAEIVYDEAPGISGILFASGILGAGAEKAASIDLLVSHGARVIADDIGILIEPFFQDGVVALATDRARAAGVAFFSAAGNDAQQAWEGPFTPSGANEDFDPGAGVDAVQTIGTVPAGVTTTVVLQWAEPWGHASTDLALDIYQIGGGAPALIDTADSNNLATGIPLEAIGVGGGATALTFGIGIRRVAGTANPLMKFVDFSNSAGSVNIEYGANSGTITDAAAANGALAVAASSYLNPATPEPFSSQGPVTVLFDAGGNPLATPSVRQKPELAAPDRVTTTVPGFAPFPGTSAAAPAAAGIAALILGAKPFMGVDELYAIMTSPANALDCTLSGAVPDLNCGAGFALADRMLAMALDSTPPVITPVIAPAAPDGANGWYRGPVSVSWNVSDAESPVVTPAGCAPVSPADGPTSLACSATSAGGTTSVPLTIKRDSTPPTAPTFAGIRAKKYLPAALPKRSAVKCGASDPTSGLATCAVTGYSAGFGRHKLAAVATNEAGLTTTTKLTYSVAKPVSISRLALAKGLTLAKLKQSGLPLTVHVAAASTRLVVKLVGRLPAGGTSAVVALGGLTKRVSKGTVHLRLTLTAQARLQLSAASQATLEITVSGTSARAKGTSLKRSIVVRS